MNCSAISSRFWTVAASFCRTMIAFEAKSLGLSVAQARLAGTISHPDRRHDDLANAVAGAAALSKFGGYETSLRWVSGDGAAWTAKTPGWAPLIGI